MQNVFSAATTLPARLVARLARFDLGVVAIVATFVLLLPLLTPRVALSDEVQYYAYLRSVYFDRDLDFRNEYAHFAAIGQGFGDPAVFNALLREDAANPNPVTGLLRNVAPVGSALLWAPGFILADGVVLLANAAGAEIPRDGFSRPYIVGACLMTALYSLLGLLLCYRLARRLLGVGQFAAATATLTVFLATPLVFYSVIAMPWSHANGFFLFSLFLTLWSHRQQGPVLGWRALRSWLTWAGLGLIGGLMTITREQLGLLLLIPALESLIAYAGLLRVRDWRAIGQRIGGHLIFLLALGAALVPQLVAYQILNGRPAPSSTVAGKLNWASPRFFDTLLDPAHGAFLWSPILPIGLLGLLLVARRDWLLAALLAVGFVAQTYINGAFGTTWHLSGSFGFRRLIECTPLIIFGVAMLVERLQAKLGPWPLLACALLLIGWNIGLIAQWTIIRPELRRGLIWEGMLRYQLLEVPGQVLGRLWQLLFDRCALVRNQVC